MLGFDVVNFGGVDECQKLVGRFIGYFLSHLLPKDLKSIAHSVLFEIVLQ